jgi:tripartite-type tricarboxylate transporter receptor subunit TctC
VLREPEASRRLAAQGAEIVASSPAEFRAFIAAERARLAQVILAASIRLD